MLGGGAISTKPRGLRLFQFDYLGSRFFHGDAPNDGAIGAFRWDLFRFGQHLIRLVLAEHWKTNSALATSIPCTDSHPVVPRFQQQRTIR